MLASVYICKCYAHPRIDAASIEVHKNGIGGKRGRIMRNVFLAMCLFASSLTSVLAADGFFVGASGQLFVVDVQDFDGNEVGYKLYGGYRFHSMDNFLDYIAVEASWQESGEMGDDVDIAGESIHVDLEVGIYLLPESAVPSTGALRATRWRTLVNDAI
jgi:hypothetical protein